LCFTAGVGVWTAYNQQAALDKFRILVGSLVPFSCYCNTSLGRNSGLFYRYSAWLEACLPSIFHSHTIGVQVQLIPLFNRIGEYWMDIRYTLRLPSVVDDIAGGVFGIFIPLQMALFFMDFKERRMGVIIYSTITTMLISARVILTGLRAAWGALAAGLCLSIALILSSEIAVTLFWAGLP
jgi:hypothetical protein